MSAFSLFIAGLIASIVGTILPGLINLTAAKVAMISGKMKAFWFSLGASIVIFLQVWVAIQFAKYIDLNPIYRQTIQVVGLLTFLGLSYYFLIVANKKKPYKKEEKIKIRTKSSRFFLGMLISILNLFPLPYYAIIALTMSARGYLVYELSNIISMSFGAMIGGFIVFIGYAFFFTKNDEKSFVFKNINYIIGGLTSLIAILTLYKLIF